MSRWHLKEHYYLGIGAHSVTLVDASTNTLLRVPYAITSEETSINSMSNFREALETAKRMKEVRGSTIKTVISDYFSRYWIMKAPKNTASLRQLEGVAKIQGVALFGSLEKQVVTGDWNTSRMFMCTALPDWQLEGIYNVFPQTTEPVGCLQLLLQDTPRIFKVDGWTCITAPTTTTLISIVLGELAVVRSFRVPLSYSVADRLFAATIELNRAARRAGVKPPSTAAWVPLFPKCFRHSMPDSMEVNNVKLKPDLSKSETPNYVDIHEMASDSDAAVLLVIGPQS